MSGPREEPQGTPPAEAVARAVRAVDGVVDLHAGALGETVTLLPGRRVPGVRLRDDDTEVHVAVAHGADLRGVADAVRRAVREVRALPVTVVVEDVLGAEEPAGPAEPTAPHDIATGSPEPETVLHDIDPHDPDTHDRSTS